MRWHLRTNQAHPLWINSLEVRGGDWVVHASVQPLEDTSIRVEVERSLDEVCWEEVFSGRQFMSLSAGRRCTLHASETFWRPAAGELTFSLEEFQQADEAPDPIVFGAGPGPLNPWVALRRHGTSYLVPTLTVLSAVAFPTPNAFRALMSPGNFGYTAVPKLGGWPRMDVHHFGPWPPPGERARWQLKSRFHECMAFWLEFEERRRAIRRCFYDVFEGRPIRVPQAPGSIRLRWEGYQEGTRVVIERMGAHQASEIWPRNWKVSELIGSNGRTLSACAGIPPKRDGSTLFWP